MNARRVTWNKRHKRTTGPFPSYDESEKGQYVETGLLRSAEMDVQGREGRLLFAHLGSSNDREDSVLLYTFMN